MKTFCTYAAVQALIFTILVFNLRMIADKRVVAALASDALYAILNFFVLHKIFKEASGKTAWAGYTVGSVAGTAIGMWLGQ